ncbi:MAG: hypothetical protein A2X95_02020 [Syntrophobacterales bacterium GWF2_56_9]|nr:MAG: hypothetical protein A2X95_02020 [Syntrophobacterales bacterium GWF2_56_9]
MGKFSILVKNIKEMLFGRDQRQTDSKTIPSLRETKAPPHESSDSIQLAQTKRTPYFIQIGFDFGTSYCKCICRDIVIDKAWVHLPPETQEQELPFLISSVLVLKDGVIGHVGNCRSHYPENGLYHLKHALVKTARQEWDAPVLAPYYENGGSVDGCPLAGFVEACAVYFLAGAFGQIQEDVRRRLPNFGKLPNDYMAINLAVPVADPERPEVNALFQKILCEAWSLASELAGHPPVSLPELAAIREKNKNIMDDSLDKACFIYPEVSSNVQGFVKSRVSSPGIYLFSDTGAGTVDQSVFIFMRRNDNQSEHLTYLHGGIFPLGSSQIEHKAASMSGSVDRVSLERWREKKEKGDSDRELMYAREWIAEGLKAGTQATLAFTKKKLFVKDQLNDIKVIFGGGGHCEHPYKTAVMYPFTGQFSGQLFRQSIMPDVVGLPVPRDLELNDSETRWMRRLSVAYGLSFEKSDLAGFTYPKDVDNPTPDQIWPRRKEIPAAPSKDVC